MKIKWILLLLLLSSVVVTHVHADGMWNRGDEQQSSTGSRGSSSKFKYGRRVGSTGSGYKSPSGIGQSKEEQQQQQQQESMMGDLDDVGGNELDDDIMRHSGQQETVQSNMDSLVNEMRSKAVSKVYQQMEQEPVEQQHTMDQESSSVDSGGNIRVAVQSKRRFEFVPVHFDRDDQKMPRMIEIVSDTMPLRLHFKSQSAAIVVSQSHMSPPMKPIEESVTMDEPYRLSHEVHKPIIQEVKEIIQPYRNIVQTLKPVIEDIRTIVPQDNDVNHQHGQRTMGGKTGSVSDWNMPSGGGKTGSVGDWNTGGGGKTGNVGEWNPIGTRRLQSPVSMRPAQMPRFSTKYTYNTKRPSYDTVKGSETQKFQRRVQFDGHRSRRHLTARNPKSSNHHHHHRGSQHHHHLRSSSSVRSRSTPMQFGSSEMVYVPMMPSAASPPTKYYSKSLINHASDPTSGGATLGDLYKGSNQAQDRFDEFKRFETSEAFESDSNKAFYNPHHHHHHLHSHFDHYEPEESRLMETSEATELPEDSFGFELDDFPHHHHHDSHSHHHYELPEPSDDSTDLITDSPTLTDGEEFYR